MLEGWLRLDSGWCVQLECWTCFVVYCLLALSFGLGFIGVWKLLVWVVLGGVMFVYILALGFSCRLDLIVCGMVCYLVSLGCTICIHGCRASGFWAYGFDGSM